MNRAYIGKLMELAERDQDVLHLLADSGTGYDEMFRKNYPARIFNFGIGEENMIAAAAGMASVGKRPFVFTSGAFLAYRALEFIRDDICFQKLNVKIVGMGSGLSWSSLGPTHHTTEDIAVLRAMPELMILSPATPIQVSACTEAAYEHEGPVYIRIGMNGETEYFKEDEPKLSKNGVVSDGSDIAIFVTGSILDEAYKATALLNNDGISVRLINVVLIKPFQEKDILETVKNIRHIFTVEEHNIHGGLGSLVAETLAYHGAAARVVPIGINDIFALGYGTHADVRRSNMLDAKSIYKKIREALS